MKLQKLSLEKKKILYGYGFISPFIFGILIFFVYSVLNSFRLSVSKITKFQGFVMEWSGFGNYAKIFIWDMNFLPEFLNSIKDTLINTPIIIIFSLFLAVLINKPIKLKGFFRWIFFIPVLLGTGYVMKQLLGLGVNEEAMDIARGIMLPKEAMMYLGPKVSGILLDILGRMTIIFWKSGVQIVIFLAGLQSINKSLYESAQCDSATEWEMFWKITLPMITPVIMLNIIYSLIVSFTDSGNKIVDYILETGFKKLQFEYASAIGWVYFIFIFILSIIVFALLNKHGYKTNEK